MATLVFLSSCAGSKSTGGAGAQLSGTLAIDGSSTVFPISQAVAEEFSAEAPRVKVSVGTSGTGGGFEKFCNGETDISDASRPIKEEEEEVCRRRGIEFLELRVALDGISILVNPQNNWAQCLTLDELKAIWRPESKTKRWNQVRAGFPPRPLKLYGAGTDSGTFDYFTSAIVGEGGASRTDYVASEDDNVLVQGIAGDQNALGYLGYGYYVQNKRRLRSVAVDSGAGCIQPSEESISSGSYSPLSRPLFIYINDRAAARREVAYFVDFFLREVNGLVKDVGYLPLPTTEFEKEVAKWKAFQSST